MTEQLVVHRLPSEREGAESQAMRQALERLGKPLQAVLVTHSYPDHYAGLAQVVAGDDVPIIAPQG